MKPKKQYSHPDLFQSRLESFINMNHELSQLASEINWSNFEQRFGQYYSEETGRPGHPTRLLVGLHYLKHAYNESDESVVERWVENPYWQYFCGFDYFQTQQPLHPTSLTKWRQRVGADLELLLKELIDVALRKKYLKSKDLARVTVDTTVQEKAIAFPTDARHYFKMIKKLNKAANSLHLKLRQSYSRLSKKALREHSRTLYRKQYRVAKSWLKSLKTWLGRLYRELYRLVPQPEGMLGRLLELTDRLLQQQKNSKDKIYSLHALEVKCFSKGKAHQRYEFGNKVSLATTTDGNWIVGCLSFEDNVYDGHTLQPALDQVVEMTGKRPQHAYVDLGYRGHGISDSTEVHLVDGRKRKKQSRSAWEWMKRRSAIEPIIGHLKADNRLRRNYLKGTAGDRINAILSACGFNFRKLLRAFFLYFIRLTSYMAANSSDYVFRVKWMFLPPILLSTSV